MTVDHFLGAVCSVCDGISLQRDCCVQTALAPVLSKSMKETSERKPSAASSPHLSSLDRARAAALEELRAGREREASSNLVASLIRGDGLRRPRTMQSTSPTRGLCARPVRVFECVCVCEREKGGR